MNSKVISVVKYVLSLVLAFVLLYFAFRNVDFREFWAKTKEVDYTWVLLSIVLSLIAYYARAYRWNILLKPLGYPGLNVHRTNLAVLIGYLANLAFPRLGEVTRCAMLKRSDDIPVSTSFGTVITERIIDLITLILLILITLIAEYDRLVKFAVNTISGLGSLDEALYKGLIFMALSGTIAAAVVYILYVKSLKFREILKDFVNGLLSLRQIENIGGFILATIVLWVTYYLMSYVIIFSIPETDHLPWMVGVMLLITGGIALALPVQGGIGTYHAFISSMLVLYAVEKTTGVFLATLLHTSQIVAIAIFGTIALVISVFINKKKADEPDKA